MGLQSIKFREWTSDNKFASLLVQDLSIDIRSETIQALSDYETRTGLPRAEINVLDFGCGRGAFVGRLRQRGWRAFGTEIDDRFVRAGALVNAMATDAYPLLTTVQEDGRSLFPDGYFDIIVSNQVLEHVANLDAVVCEMSRQLKPGGIMLHYFPAQFRLVDAHYRLPFAHWLPKNRSRRLAIGMMTLAGLGVRGCKPLTPKQRTDVIFQYSVEETFYRKPTVIKQAFEVHGLQADFSAILKRRLEQKIARLPSIGATFWQLLARTLPLIWAYTTFKEAIIFCSRKERCGSS